MDALGETVTPVVSVLQAATSGTSNSSNLITAESLSTDTKLILEEISRYLNLEKLLPSYKYTVTKSCLKAIRKLQKTGHLPSNPGLFRDYAAHGMLCALYCLTVYIYIYERALRFTSMGSHLATRQSIYQLSCLLVF